MHLLSEIHFFFLNFLFLLFHHNQLTLCLHSAISLKSFAFWNVERLLCRYLQQNKFHPNLEMFLRFFFCFILFNEQESKKRVSELDAYIKWRIYKTTEMRRVAATQNTNFLYSKVAIKSRHKRKWFNKPELGTPASWSLALLLRA